MPKTDAKVGVTREIGITVIRADGTRDELGTVTSSAWQWYSPALWRAKARTKYVNARRGHWAAFFNR